MTLVYVSAILWPKTWLSGGIAGNGRIYRGVANGIAPFPAWADGGATNETFEDVSRTLTGEQKLHTPPRGALYAAFKNSDPSVDANIARMTALIAANPD